MVVLLAITAIDIFGSDEEDTVPSQTIEAVSDVQYNEETGEFYITDENGEVTHTAENEADLYIYTIDPDYNPKLPTEDTENTTDDIE